MRYRLVKKLNINGKNQVRVLTQEKQFVHEMFIGDRYSLTGPHIQKTWKSRHWAEIAEKQYSGSEIEVINRIETK